MGGGPLTGFWGEPPPGSEGGPSPGLGAGPTPVLGDGDEPPLCSAAPALFVSSRGLCKSLPRVGDDLSLKKIQRCDIFVVVLKRAIV